MTRITLTLLSLFASASAYGVPGTPIEYYKTIQGHWAAQSGDFEVIYKVNNDSLRVEGETCTVTNDGVPMNCGLIDQGYEIRNASLYRDYPTYGLQPVQILELSATKLVKKEVHPMVRDRAAITIEEILDADTLRLTSEMWMNGRSEPQSRREFVLKKVTP